MLSVVLLYMREEQSGYLLFTACLASQLRVVFVNSHPSYFLDLVSFVFNLRALEQSLGASLKTTETLVRKLLLHHLLAEIISKNILVCIH